jgi:hypothetical protein
MVPYVRKKQFTEYILEGFFRWLVCHSLCLPTEVEPKGGVYGRKIDQCWQSETRAVLEDLDLYIMVKLTMNVDEQLVHIDIQMVIDAIDGQEKTVRVSDGVYVMEKYEYAMFSEVLTQKSEVAFTDLLQFLQTFIPSFKNLCKRHSDLL